ncbi:MAG: apolipoprotein N-acyltransferase [Planctomycetes bacterium]|nr:apolipoprotein N-acyltransferase [Planctomycetota bacterium]
MGAAHRAAGDRAHRDPPALRLGGGGLPPGAPLQRLPALWGAHLLRPRRKPGVPARARFGFAAAALALPLLAAAYGAARRDSLVEKPGPRVLLVQPAFAQTLKKEALSSLPSAEGMLNGQLAQSLEGLRLHPGTDLVVWAETMFPGELREASPAGASPDPETRTRLLRAADPMGVAGTASRRFLTGAVVRGRDREKRNAALLVGPGGRVEARFDKVHLTPFGEFVPLTRRLPEAMRRGIEDGIRSFVGFVPDLVPGSAAPVPLAVPGRGTFSLGGLVCYEVIFPGPARDRVRDGADILVNLSNYAWYGAGMREQVLDMTRIRAVECRRPVVVATNDGPTAVLDGNGDVRERLPEGEAGVLAAAVPLDGRGSLSMRVGDLLAWLAAAAALLGAAGGRAAGRRRGAAEGGRAPPSLKNY